MRIKELILWVAPCMLILYFAFMLFVFNDESKYLWVVASCLNLFVCIRFIRHIPLFLISFFMLTYMVTFRYYFEYNIYLTAWPDYQTAFLFNKVIILQSLFLTFLFCFTCDLKEKDIASFNLFIKSNTRAFWFSYLVALCALIFGMTGDSLLVAGYGAAEKIKSPLFEYFIAIFVTVLLTSKRGDKYQSIAIKLLLFAYCIKSMLYGGRVEVLQCCLLYGYYKFDFLRNLKKINIFISGLALYLILEVIGAVRGNPLAIFSMFESWDSFYSTLFEFDHSRKYISGNQGDVIQASSRLLGLLNDGYISFEYRVLSFASYLLNVFLYFGQIKSYQNLASLLQDVSRAGGGGLVSTYFYIWLGYLGPLLAGGAIGAAIRAIHKGLNTYIFIYVVLLLVSFPRWFAYGPVVLVKFCVFGAFFYWFVTTLFRSR